MHHWALANQIYMEALIERVITWWENHYLCPQKIFYLMYEIILSDKPLRLL